MFSKTLLTLAAGVAAVTAQGGLSLPSQVGGLTFSPQCQQSIISVVANGSFAQCFHTADLLPILSGNSSIIPVLDRFMSDLCYGPPCSNATLNAAAQTILAGCGGDLAGEGLPNSTVSAAFGAYPVVREVLCLKTRAPYTNTSYGGSLGSAPIPIESGRYNSTNGTFCVTSVLTQLSAYFGADLSYPYIASIVSGQNTTALSLAQGINPNILCNECIFGAIDVIERAYPIVGSVPLETVFGLLNMTSPLPAGTNLNGLLNGTCSYLPYYANANGTLPPNITVSISNSTYPYQLTTSTGALVRRMLGLLY